MSSEIVFFDVETTIPSRRGQGYALLEFGAVLVCPRTLVELDHYSTLIRPRDLSSITLPSVRCNGITRDQVESAPTFAHVADRVYTILHGRVWAGHNIMRFDSLRVREAFAEIGRPMPEPKGMIDSYPLLEQRFGRRAGNMKMATLASYFGLGQQKHRSLDDVRMNIEVLKYCATVLFLESVNTESLLVRSQDSQTVPCTSNGAVSVEEIIQCPNPLSHPTVDNNENMPSLSSRIVGVQDQPGCSTQVSVMEPLPMALLIEQMRGASMQRDDQLSGFSESENTSWYAGYVDPGRVSKSLIHATVVSSNQHSKPVLLYNNEPLQLYCMGLRVRFGLSRKFVDHAGRPKLNIVLDAPATLSQLIEFCDDIAQRSCLNSGSSSEWRSSNKKNVYPSWSTIRLNIPTMVTDAATIFSAEIYKIEKFGNNDRLVSLNFDSEEIDSLFVPGAFVDAFFTVDVYDYQQSAGIRLVAKRLVVHANT